MSASVPRAASPQAPITHVTFVRASRRHEREGLLGWVKCVVADTLVLDGIALRRTLAGRLSITFPEREDGAGRRHSYIHPVDRAAAQQIERAIFKALATKVTRGHTPPA